MKNSKEEIKVKANHSNRTFTIRKSSNGKVFTKYRTIKFNGTDFDSELNNTENDWKNFLRTQSYDYYSIRKC